MKCRSKFNWMLKPFADVHGLDVYNLDFVQQQYHPNRERNNLCLITIMQSGNNRWMKLLLFFLKYQNIGNGNHPPEITHRFRKLQRIHQSWGLWGSQGAPIKLTGTICYKLWFSITVCKTNEDHGEFQNVKYNLIRLGKISYRFHHTAVLPERCIPSKSSKRPHWTCKLT